MWLVVTVDKFYGVLHGHFDTQPVVKGEFNKFHSSDKKSTAVDVQKLFKLCVVRILLRLKYSPMLTKTKSNCGSCTKDPDRKLWFVQWFKILCNDNLAIDNLDKF